MSNQNNILCIRTCLVCGKKISKDKFIRIIKIDDKPKIDINKSTKCRGYYIMPCNECFLKAQENNLLGRKLKTKIDDKFWKELSSHCK